MTQKKKEKKTKVAETLRKLGKKSKKSLGITLGIRLCFSLSFFSLSN